MKKSVWIIFAIYAVLGFYLINYAINFFEVPESVSQFNEWIILLGGIFLLFGGINLVRLKKRI